MLYREIIALCSQIHTERINTLYVAERRILGELCMEQTITTGL